MIGSALLSVALAAGPADPEGPTPAPSAAPSASEFDLAQQAWQRRYRRLRVQTGVSWGLTAVGVVGMVIPIAKLASYHSSPDTLELDHLPGRLPIKKRKFYNTTMTACALHA